MLLLREEIVHLQDTLAYRTVSNPILNKSTQTPKTTLSARRMESYRKSNPYIYHGLRRSGCCVINKPKLSSDEFPGEHTVSLVSHVVVSTCHPARTGQDGNFW